MKAWLSRLKLDLPLPPSSPEELAQKELATELLKEEYLSDLFLKLEKIIAHPTVLPS